MHEVRRYLNGHRPENESTSRSYNDPWPSVRLCELVQYQPLSRALRRIASSRLAPCQNHGWQWLTLTALTSGPTVMVARPSMLLLLIMSLVLVEDKSA